MMAFFEITTFFRYPIRSAGGGGGSPYTCGFTTLGVRSPLIAATTLSATVRAMSMRSSLVAVPICGVKTTLDIFSSLGSGFGSDIGGS